MKAFLLALVAALLLASTPLAAAQASVLQPKLTVLVTDPGEDLVTTRPSSLEVIVRYSFPPGTVVSEPVRVKLEVALAPAWTSPELDPQEVLLTIDDPAKLAAGGSVEGFAVANLTLDHGAPARVREPFVVKGTSEPQGNLAGATGQSPEIGLQAAFVGNLTVTAPQVVRVKGGTPSEVAFEVVNHGNGDTPVAFDLLARPKNSVVEAPAAIDLAPGESRVVTVLVRTPWTSAEKGILTLQATPERAGDDAKGFDATVQVTGTAAIPGAGAFAGLAALALAAATRRRAR